MVSASGLKESKGSGWWQCTILTFCPKCHDKAMQYASLISSIPDKEGRGYGDHGKYDWQIIYFQFNPIFRLKGDNGGLTILSSCRECQRQSSMVMTWWRVRVVALLEFWTCSSTCICCITVSEIFPLVRLCQLYPYCLNRHFLFCCL